MGRDDIASVHIDTDCNGNGLVMKFTLQQLGEQSGVTERTIRFYIQKGMMARPHGETRAAFYTEDHLATRLRSYSWQHTGLSLTAISDLLLDKHEAPISPERISSIEVRSHLNIANGVELQIEPQRAGLSQTKMRQLFQVMQADYSELSNDN